MARKMQEDRHSMAEVSGTGQFRALATSHRPAMDSSTITVTPHREAGSRLLSFATEASHAGGLGHFMRCFALAQEARARGIESRFFLKQASAAMRARLAGIGAQWVEAGEQWAQACLAQAPAADAWWVVDSYAATTDLLDALRRRNRVLYFDDLCALPHFPCDLVLNASPQATHLPYADRMSARCSLLAGPAYAQIRMELRKAARMPGLTRGSPRQIGLILGGSDATGLALQVLTSLRAALPDADLQAFMGPASADISQVREAAMRQTKSTVLSDPPDLAERLAACDLVVTAAGSSVWELCALRQAAIALVVADNQVAVLQACPFPSLDARQGVPSELGELARRLLADPSGLERIRQRAVDAVDGQGAARTLAAMGLGRPATPLPMPTTASPTTEPEGTLR